MTKQSTIDKNQNAMRILRIMNGHESSRLWTVEDIWSHLVKVSLDTVRKSMKYLLERGFVCRTGMSVWSITTDGRREYESAVATNTKTENTLEFRTEALTGMDKEGRETRLRRAVLPTIGQHISNASDVVLTKLCGLDEIAKVVKLSLEKTAECLRTGEVHICKSCGEWARFHGHTSARDGKLWQSRCIACRKKSRK